ncbi:MFS transporter [Clostridium arbusti]|uniref:MFS transporter n=1 Tax=Clostridium arbusti TaxID=1137848 RepID=UPI0002884CAB|nr:MFS transporter [Clostridium arbusti]
MNKNNIRIIYTVFVFVALAAFDNIIIGLFPPLFSSIAKDLNITMYSLGDVSAINILVTAVSSILWGYAAGKYNRKRLIMFGTIIWSIAVFFTSRSDNYLELVISQFFTGIGLGCIASIGFSVLTDFIPYKYRGMLLSLWGMSQGFGGILGSLMASIIVTSSSWRKPFEIVSFIGLFLTILYIFIKEPTLGGAEPELKKLVNEGNEYNYTIQLNEIKSIILKKTNLLLLFQGVFMNITTGSLIWLPTLYISKIQNQGYDNKTAIIAAGYLYAILQLGGLASAGFGYLGDLFQRKSYKGRALMTSFFVFITMPLYIIMFMMPMNKLYIDNSSTYSILISLLREIFINPWMLGIFILAFFASAAQSCNTPNWLALITDVNLPEHRGAAFSISNLANSFGRTVGNMGIGYLISFISIYKSEPNNYVITMILFQVFLIPAAACYLKIAKTNIEDIKEVKKTLYKRAKVN